MRVYSSLCRLSPCYKPMFKIQFCIDFTPQGLRSAHTGACALACSLAELLRTTVTPAQSNKPQRPVSSIPCPPMTALGTHRPSPSPRFISSVTRSQPLLASVCRHSTFLAIPCLFPRLSQGETAYSIRPGHLLMPSTMLHDVPCIMGTPPGPDGGCWGPCAEQPVLP